MNNKVALITGASSGIGKATAIRLKKRGFTVYGAARRTSNMEELKAQQINIVSLDVTDEKSMVSCVNNILKKEGHIDVLVNNAGYGSYGSIEDIPLEEARRQLEVNLFGLARMTQLVLPSMRKHRFGKIVNISSMAGKVCTPFGGWYHAAKFALEGFSDCLRMETAQFGIDVIIIEPGGIKTDWGLIAADNLKKSSSDGAYTTRANSVSNAMAKLYSGWKLTSPDVIAQTIEKAITTRKPKTRYLLGHGAKASVFVKRIVSDRTFDKIIQKVFDY